MPVSTGRTAGQTITAADINGIATLLNTVEADAVTQADLSNFGNVVTAETTTSTSFVDLATVGPSVAVTVGSSGKVLVLASATIANATAGFGGIVSLSGGGLTASLTRRLQLLNATAGSGQAASVAWFLTGIAAGSQTFKLQYRVSGGGTCEFSNRELLVVPL